MRQYKALPHVLLFLLALFSLSSRADELSCPKDAKPGDIKLLKDKPVEASLTIDSSFAGVASATIMIATGTERFCIETILSPQHSGGSEAMAEEGHRHVTWSAPYLLVEADSNFRQDVLNKTWIFKLRKKKLTRLGAVGGDLAKISSGRFRSLYNKAAVWQADSFECTACKTQLALVIEDQNGKLAANADETWKANQKQWQTNEKMIATKIAAGAPRNEDKLYEWRQTAVRALIENIVIAAYCRQDEEVKRLTALADANLDRTSHDDVVKALKQVVPLEAPDRWNAVWEQ